MSEENRKVQETVPVPVTATATEPVTIHKVISWNLDHYEKEYRDKVKVIVEIAWLHVIVPYCDEHDLNFESRYGQGWHFYRDNDLIAFGYNDYAKSDKDRRELINTLNAEVIFNDENEIPMTVGGLARPYKRGEPK